MSSSFFDDLSGVVSADNKRKRELYEEDTRIDSTNGFCFFALLEQYKTPFIESELNTLKQLERIGEQEETGFKNRILVLLQKEKIRRLEDELLVAKTDNAALSKQLAVLEPIGIILQEDELLKATLSDLARINAEVDQECKRVKSSVQFQLNTMADKFHVESSERRDKSRNELDMIYAHVIKNLNQLATSNTSHHGVQLFVDRFVESMEKVRLINECQ